MIRVEGNKVFVKETVLSNWWRTECDTGVIVQDGSVFEVEKKEGAGRNSSLYKR